MRKLISAAIICVVVVSCSGALAKDEDKIEFGFTSDFYSKYVWRGQLLNDDPVFQPGVSASYKGFTFSLWGNVDLTNYGSNSGEFTEYDLTFDYSGTFSEESKVGYSAGVIHYHFPSLSASDTTELYWGLSFDVPLNPTITVYHGLGNENGMYANFGLSHTFEDVLKFSDTITGDVELGASIGWGNSTYNKDYWGIDGGRLNDLGLKIALPIDIGGGWAVTPSFNFVTLADGGIRNTDAFSTKSDYFFTGVSISKSF
ncbi:MAG: hypothetical protein JW804_03765 [Sedimentisphaerales bacterium]|nr:hypothetical protein [Sedimentisphaerales bacterium]